MILIILVAYINWNDGEPNSYFESEDCVEVKPAEGFGWNDERCDQMKPAICEKRGKFYFHFLVAKILYNSLCPSVRQSVRP